MTVRKAFFSLSLAHICGKNREWLSFGRCDRANAMYKYVMLQMQSKAQGKLGNIVEGTLFPVDVLSCFPSWAWAN